MEAIPGPTNNNKPSASQGVQVVDVANNNYQLDEAALERILLRDDVKDLPVVVVSVAGSFRGGKSFLLNFFLRYLTAPDGTRNENGDWMGVDTEALKGFSWRGGSRRHTTGIVMWSEPFVSTLPSGDKVAVLLMDTQGTFDSSSTVRDCSTIFALSNLISSVQIYNIKDNIKENDLQNLQLFTEYGKLLKSDDGKKPFQTLEFLIRDWQYDYEHQYGRKGGEELLAIRMNETENMPTELRELRRQLRSCFETFTCFLMPHPGRLVSKKRFTGALSELDKDFKDSLKELVPSIFAPANLTPKLINGELVKARDLFTYFKTYMGIFNSDKIPSPVSVAKATEKAALLAAVRDARELYETRMDRVTGVKQPSLTRLALDDEHRKAVEAAKAFFNDKKKMASKKESNAYLAEMTQEMEDRLPQYMLLNEGKLRKTIEEAREIYYAAIRQVHGTKLLCVHPLDLEDIHNGAVRAALTVYDAKRKQLPNIPDLERLKFIEVLQKELESLRNINEQHNKMSVLAVQADFSTTLEALLSREPPLDDEEFEDKYNEAKASAVGAFETKRNKTTEHEEDVYKASLLQSMATQFSDLQSINRSKNRRAFQRAIDFYKNEMTRFWNRDSYCVHPDDLLQAHENAKEQALHMFHPHKEINDNDFDKDLLLRIFGSKYFELKEQNDTMNELAVDAAVRKYVSQMEEKTKASWWWLTIVPMIVMAAKLPRYHRESREAALNVFYNRRRYTTNSGWDRYLSSLNYILVETLSLFLAIISQILRKSEVKGEVELAAPPRLTCNVSKMQTPMASRNRLKF